MVFGAVFQVTEWEGEPHETEEMAPQWFNNEDIPYGVAHFLTLSRSLEFLHLVFIPAFHASQS